MSGERDEDVAAYLRTVRMTRTASGWISSWACVFSAFVAEPVIVASDDAATHAQPIAPSAAEARECPSDTVLVHGGYCPDVEQRCSRWLDADQSPEAHGGIGPMRCAEFAPPRCLSSERQPKRFCIDRFEWPNVAGALPIVAVTWHDARRSCESIGKRLCASSEWTFACEGEEMRPYPYGDGLRRDELACGQTHEPMPVGTPRDRWPEFYQGHPSGSAPRCVSPFGAYDMVAGVDEWVVNESGRPYASGLKGGYGTPYVRTRCRPMTVAHGPDFSYYQVGFRCCADAATR